MSIIGFILGYGSRHLSATRPVDPDCSLGDRHLENILMDSHTGDVVHVDFNCLFEKVCLPITSKRYNH